MLSTELNMMIESIMKDRSCVPLTEQQGGDLDYEDDEKQIPVPVYVSRVTSTSHVLLVPVM